MQAQVERFADVLSGTYSSYLKMISRLEGRVKVKCNQCVVNTAASCLSISSFVSQCSADNLGCARIASCKLSESLEMHKHSVGLEGLDLSSQLLFGASRRLAALGDVAHCCCWSPLPSFFLPSFYKMIERGSSAIQNLLLQMTHEVV